MRWLASCFQVKIHLKFAILAQLVEQLTRNEQVVGSNPMDGSNKNKGLRKFP